MKQARSGQTATLLPGGEVLVAGGGNGGTSLDTAELFDQATGTWTSAAAMLVGRSRHAATLLLDGSVLVVGGSETPESQEHVRSAEIYDPTTNTWASAARPAGLQQIDSMTLLTSGEVLVVGTLGSEQQAPDGAVIYDPSLNTWRSVAAPNQTRHGAATVALAEGKVLVTGGYIVTQTFPPVQNHFTLFDSAEEYDQQSNTWHAVAPMQQVRAEQTATVLPSGKVLVAGGVYEIQISGGLNGANSLASTEIYDPKSETWAATAPMNLARAEDSATLLPDGDVLVAGGYDCGSGACVGYGGSGDCCGASSAELYQPANNGWTFTAPATTGTGHTATSLANGAVLVTGGRLGIINNDELTGPEIYASQYPPDEPLVQPLSGGVSTATPKALHVGPPLLTRLAETHRTWREGNAAAGSLRRRRPPPRGTTFSLTLSERAKVTFTFVRREAGRRAGRRCVPAVKTNRHRPRCTRSEVRGTLTLAGNAGANKLFFHGRVSSSKVLPLGEYIATITATNVSGESSVPQRVSFTIVR
jgi:N-acetylneuraminic acid mutarotase